MKPDGSGISWICEDASSQGKTTLFNEHMSSQLLSLLGGTGRTPVQVGEGIIRQGDSWGLSKNGTMWMMGCSYVAFSPPQFKGEWYSETWIWSQWPLTFCVNLGDCVGLAPDLIFQDLKELKRVVLELTFFTCSSRFAWNFHILKFFLYLRI